MVTATVGSPAPSRTQYISGFILDAAAPNSSGALQYGSILSSGDITLRAKPVHCCLRGAESNLNLNQKGWMAEVTAIA
jgi:hypothetical protein